MSGQVQVRSVEALDALHADFKRFAGEAQGPLQAAALEVQRTLTWLAERQGYWRARVQFSTMAAERTRRAYQACRESGAREPRTGQYRQPDCWPQYKALQEAEALLREATGELAKVERALREVQQAAEAYAVQARRLNALLTGDMPRGVALLGRSIDRLRAFLSMRVPQHGYAENASLAIAGALPDHTSNEGSRTMDLSMAEPMGHPTTPSPAWAEYVFHDANSRNLLLLAHRVGDEYYIRVHDLDLTPSVRRDAPSVANGGYANMLLERDDKGTVTRARLQDIMVTPSHRLSGIGSQLLEEAERFAREQGAAEVYGDAPSDVHTRDWYANRGYAFRTYGGGEMVLKALQRS